MIKEGKIWGENILIFKNDHIQINQIYIKKGGRCSKHYHRSKNNMFFIQAGELLIEKWNSNGIIDSTILESEQKTIIPSNVYHRFTAIQDTQALEIYYSDIDLDDIVREDIGSYSPGGFF